MTKFDEPYKPRQYFHVAVIIGAHGIRGELRAKALSDETRLSDLDECYLLSPDEQTAIPVKFSAKPHKGQYIVSLDTVKDRDAAEAMRSYYFAVAREDAPALPEGRYYASDLVGCRVFTQDRGEIGVIADTISGPGADIFEIKRSGKSDLLVPILEDTLVKVDIIGRRVDLKLAEGLWEIYD